MSDHIWSDFFPLFHASCSPFLCFWFAFFIRFQNGDHIDSVGEIGRSRWNYHMCHEYCYHYVWNAFHPSFCQVWTIWLILICLLILSHGSFVCECIFEHSAFELIWQVVHILIMIPQVIEEPPLPPFILKLLWFRSVYWRVWNGCILLLDLDQAIEQVFCHIDEKGFQDLASILSIAFIKSPDWRPFWVGKCPSSYIILYIIIVPSGNCPPEYPWTTWHHSYLVFYIFLILSNAIKLYTCMYVVQLYILISLFHLFLIWGFVCC